MVSLPALNNNNQRASCEGASPGAVVWHSHSPGVAETVARAGQVMGKSWMLRRVSVCRGARWESVHINAHSCQFTKPRAFLEPRIREKNPKSEVDAMISIAERGKWGSEGLGGLQTHS